MGNCGTAGAQIFIQLHSCGQVTTAGALVPSPWPQPADLFVFVMLHLAMCRYSCVIVDNVVKAFNLEAPGEMACSLSDPTFEQLKAV